jgi:hypothetical protein
MWYQSFSFTLLLILAAVGLAFLAFIYNKTNKRLQAFIAVTCIFLALAGALIFFETKYRQKLSRFKVVNYQFKSIADLSDFEGDKYAATVITDSNLDATKLKKVISEAKAQVLKEKSDASIIWLTLYDSNIAATDKPDAENPNFIAQAQWKRKSYVGLLPQSFVSNDNYKDIEIYFGRLTEK